MFVRTDRLFLRPAWREDAPELTRAIAHEPVVRMLARAPWPYYESHARAWIAAAHDPRLPTLLVTVPGEGRRIVGGCGLHAEDGSSVVGYWIEPLHWGRGFATEALRGMLTLARTLGHRQIVGRHAADNPASGRVLRKAGFVPTGRARPFRSLGRAGELRGPEYALDLAGEDGPQDAPMRYAA
ncbi:MAG: GNAT family N-acetyltransferase [Croceibacterium sp.]